MTTATCLIAIVHLLYVYVSRIFWQAQRGCLCEVWHQCDIVSSKRWLYSSDGQGTLQ